MIYLKRIKERGDSRHYAKMGNQKAKNRTLDILRWIVLLPGAATASWLGWTMLNILGKFSLGYVGVSPHSLLGQFYYNTAGHAIMGAVFVYLGAKIAPSYRRIVAYVLASLGLVLAGFLLFPAIMVRDCWAIWGAICIVGGIGAITYCIHQGETDIE